jgi:hypothetical protein
LKYRGRRLKQAEKELSGANNDFQQAASTFKRRAIIKTYSKAIRRRRKPLISDFT